MTPTVTPAQLAAIRQLASALPAGAYLAGGVAIAATLHHRTSLDLDFFVPTDFDPDRVAERLTADVPALAVTGTAPGTLYLEVQGVPVSFLSYRYPLLSEPVPNAELNVPVASLEDLVCMKLSAIASRGMARDFWDLHGLLEHGVADGDLETALGLYRRKFTDSDVGHVVRSLAYFGEADAAPLPLGLERGEWERIKQSFERSVLALRLSS